MTDFSEDSQGFKIPPLTISEPSKKKKQPRKKAENKQLKMDVEVTEPVPEPANDLDSDLVLYAYKLEAELARAKKKLRTQRQTFRHVIHSLAKNIDTKGITSHIVEDYLQNLNPRLADLETDSKYEKFFTNHKFLIIEDKTEKEAIPKKTIAKASKAEKATPVEDSAPSGIPIPPFDTTQSGSTKKAKKEKAAGGEGETKKRKPKAHKESDDISENGIEIMEIPPPAKSKPKKEDNVGYNKQEENNLKAMQQQQQHLQHQHQHQHQQQQQQSLQMNNMLEDGLKSLMQQVNIDPTALMNAYLMTGQGMPGLVPGMTDADLGLYGKALQELMKMGAHIPGRPDNAGNDTNYYSRNFQ